jgi:hypothetical protein
LEKAEAKDIIQYWKQKIKEYYKPLNAEGIATKIILTYISEIKLITMWNIFCTLRFMLSELPVYLFPVKALNTFQKELDRVRYLSFQDKKEILEFIEIKINKAINKQTAFAKEYRKVKSLRRYDFSYRYNFPETILSEAKNRANFALACLFYFFHYELPEFINSSELKERIKQIEISQGFEFDPFDKVPYIELDVGIFLDKNDHKDSRENKKWIIVIGFIYEQLGIERDKEEILKTLKRYGVHISAVYSYIYDTFPHGEFPFAKLPMPSGKPVFDEKGNYLGTRFIFFD